ncbi:hypothetical protein [Anaeromyxobacter oryzae]|uniref:Uncharacterized protein n=1 Tax=Anaeromyxobacter oryzae TaxID=2918170 RepID=A0ABM7X4Y0_9BACT|nr:hypothetical protein [Anaeromyxobacter oryzae]BDG06825.1 hypothetical protein AMOR_58210 [Anaeromyxobacter oryzae]
MRSPWAAFVLAAPLVAAGQPVELGAARRIGGTVLGRVCLDVDGDGRCEEEEPGVAGARVIASAGGVAIAGPDGRFHLLDVPDRVVARDRTAYGGLSIAVEGLGARAAVELAAEGAASVDLAVPAAPAGSPPALALDPEAVRPPAPGEREILLAGRVPVGSVVEVGGVARAVGAGGEVLVPVPLEHGARLIELVIRAPGGAVSIVAWPVFVGRRADGSVLVLPGAPERVATVAAAPAAGGGLLVSGTIAPGRRPRIAGALATPGAGGTFAAFAPAGAPPELEVLEADVARVRVPLAAPAAAGMSVATALGEAEVSFLGRPGLLVTGRASGALRARLGAVDVEAGADLDDRDRLGDLARPRDALTLEHALEPARTFLTAGDAGAADDRNAARGRLWARVAGDGGRLELGGARAGLTGSELGRYDRALFGGKGEGAAVLGPVELRASAFGATLRADAAGNAPPLPAHDALSATGGALFWLSHGEVVPGSEALRVEWRDPFTGRVVRQRTLVRGEDYEISWATGRVILARPLSSVAAPAALVTADPFVAAAAVLLADYLHASAGPVADDLRGGRVSAAAGPVSLAVHGVSEDRPGSPYRLAAATGIFDLALAEVRVEAARSTGLALDAASGFSRSSDGGFVFAAPAPAAAEGDALHVEVRGGGGPVRADAWWRVREAGYSDAEFLETRAARERGAEVSLAGPVALELRWAERQGTDPRDPAGATPLDARRAVARSEVVLGGIAIAAEAIDTRLSAPAPGEETSAGLRAAAGVAPGLTLDVSHHQALRVTGAGVDPTFSAVGAMIETHEETVGLRAGWGPAIGPRLVAIGERRGPGDAVYGTFSVDPDAPSAFRSDAGTLGARRTAGDAEIFTEEQFARDPFGLRSARVVGARVAPAAGLTVSLTAERGERLRPGGEPTRRSAAAAAAGLVRGPVLAALRGEVRDEGDGHAVAAGGSVEWRLAPPATLSARAGWSQGVVGGREALDLEAAVGGALRLARASALATVARLAERRPGEARRDGVLARAALTVDAASRLSVGLAAGVAAWRSAGGRDDRLAGSVRARVRIAGPVDAAAEYARRAPLSGARLGALDAVRVEAGVAAGLSRVALGYNLVGFGGDGLDPAADTGRLYLRVQVGY